MRLRLLTDILHLSLNKCEKNPKLFAKLLLQLTSSCVMSVSECLRIDRGCSFASDTLKSYQCFWILCLQRCSQAETAVLILTTVHSESTEGTVQHC